jgi:hypothetical protein
MSNLEFFMTFKLSDILAAPEGALIVLSVPQPYWSTKRLPAELAEFDWSAVRGAITLCFHGLDDDPREIFELAEIREFVRDVIERTPELIKKMADERDWPPGLFGKWSFIAVANSEDPMDLTKFSDNPPERYGRVFIDNGYARVVRVAIN